VKVVVVPGVAGVDAFLPGLRRDFPPVDFVLCADRKQLPQLMADADVFFGHPGPDVVQNARCLRWVQSMSTGVDSMLAIPQLAHGDVLLTGARGTHSACLAESVFGMIFAFTRGIRDSAVEQRNHRWSQKGLRPGLRELTGSTLGLAGFGAMGRSIAVRALAFEMRVVAVDLYPADPVPGVVLRGMDGLEALLKESDYVVVTVPAHPSTPGMIDAKAIGLMKPSSMLVGISRGGVIDQEALADALRARRLWAAALDVFDPEPLPADSGLWDLDNLLITPHIAGGTQFEARNVVGIFRENLSRYLSGSLPLLNQVDKARGF